MLHCRGQGWRCLRFDLSGQPWGCVAETQCRVKWGGQLESSRDNILCQPHSEAPGQRASALLIRIQVLHLADKPNKVPWAPPGKGPRFREIASI